MQAVSRCTTLEGLELHNIDTATTCQALATGLLLTRNLKKFYFKVGRYLDTDLVAKQCFLRAFRNNLSLEEVSIVGTRQYYLNDIQQDYYWDDDETAALARYGDIRQDYYWNDHETAALARYAARNKSLLRWVESPGSIPVRLWPSIVKSVRRCQYGPEVVFRCLAALGSSLGPQESRKRRRSEIDL